MRRRRFNFLLSIDTTRCTGCGWCVAACPEHLLSLEAKGWTKYSVISDPDSCTGCKLCEVRCPFDVIAVVQTTSTWSNPAAVNPVQGVDSAKAV